MIICCDVDGVLNDLMQVTLNIYNERNNASIKLDDITCHGLENCFEPEVTNGLKSIFDEPDLWNKVRPVAGAQDALRYLINKGHQVYIVTNNSPYTYGQKFDWIRHYYPFIDSSKIICMKDKWYFKCDIMIEDCFETLVAKPYYHRVLMNQPWNQSTKDYIYDIYRCYNWEDIITAVNEISDGE